MINNDIAVRSLLPLPGKMEKQWWMELLKNIKKWMHKLLRAFLVISFKGITSGEKSGLPQVLEWEIKTMFGGKDYLQLQRGFIRKKRVFSELLPPFESWQGETFCGHPETWGPFPARWAMPPLSPVFSSKGFFSLGSQFAPMKPFPHLLLPKPKPKEK